MVDPRRPRRIEKVAEIVVSKASSAAMWSTLLCASLGFSTHAPAAACALTELPRSVQRAPPLVASDRRDFLSRTAVAATTPALASALGGSPSAASARSAPAWEKVDLKLAATSEPPILFDIEFDSRDPKRGWLVGNRGTFLVTADGGETWEAKSFANLDAEEEFNYRFTKVSFLDGEGWIIGKPSILLHTRDSGASWERVPLSPKLPGDPSGIVALGPGKAELSTSVGAIYVTENSGRNFKAQVQETIDATLNRVSSSGVQGASYFAGSINSIQRDAAGSYAPRHGATHAHGFGHSRRWHVHALR
jgi:hypothetical protein